MSKAKAKTETAEINVTPLKRAAVASHDRQFFRLRDRREGGIRWMKTTSARDVVGRVLSLSVSTGSARTATLDAMIAQCHAPNVPTKYYPPRNEGLMETALIMFAGGCVGFIAGAAWAGWFWEA